MCGQQAKLPQASARPRELERCGEKGSDHMERHMHPTCIEKQRRELSIQNLTNAATYDALEMLPI